MKRILLVLGTAIVALTGVSCEKHNWEDTVKVVEEEIRDEDGNLVEVRSTEVVETKGAKRFFIEDEKVSKKSKH